MREPILRLIDANANRAREGLRVLEDVARFVLDEQSLAARAKDCRHTVTELVSALRSGGRGLDAFRDSEGDVGRGRTAHGEARRARVEGIVLANAHRVQEALRVLEEFSKLADAEIASRLKDLRYSVYTLEKETIAGLQARGESR